MEVSTFPIESVCATLFRGPRNTRLQSRSGDCRVQIQENGQVRFQSTGRYIVQFGYQVQVQPAAVSLKCNRRISKAIAKHKAAFA
jgi:hypothetical protein